jgi:tRNA pseudouridine38-40 synthase
MPRYFIEVAYKGTAYAGFQVQQNANTVQAEVEKALKTYYRTDFQLTGSSRTDAGVHARQNFFHCDTEVLAGQNLEKDVYHLNAILPGDIVLQRVYQVSAEAHSRFDAVSRYYTYTIYQSKDPFMEDRAWFFPYKLDLDRLNEAAGIIQEYTDFESFAKRNSQVHTYDCSIMESYWERHGQVLIYHVRSNRFLRGMVRGLVGTMLRVGRGKCSIEGFHEIIRSHDPAKVEFATPPQGLTLQAVSYTAIKKS